MINKLTNKSHQKLTSDLFVIALSVHMMYQPCITFTFPKRKEHMLYDCYDFSSFICRLLNKDDIVILDSLNYIKGNCLIFSIIHACTTSMC